jgi:hypothetical protein
MIPPAALLRCLLLVPLLTCAFTPPPGVKVDRFIALADAPWQGAEGAGAKLRAQENLEVVARGPVTVKADVYRPDHARVLPAVLMVHGGGWTGGSKEAMRPLAKALAARGWVVVCTSYRLAGQAPYPAAVHDVKAAVRWLRAQAGEFVQSPIGAQTGVRGEPRRQHALDHQHTLSDHQALTAGQVGPAVDAVEVAEVVHSVVFRVGDVDDVHAAVHGR